MSDTISLADYDGSGTFRVVDIVSEKVNNENPEAEVKAQCDYSERLYWAQMLVGGILGNTYSPPVQYPFFNNLVCDNVDVTHGPGCMGMMKGNVWLKLHFGIPKCKDPYSTDPIDLCEYEANVSGSGITVDTTQFTWAAGPDSGEDLDDKQQLAIIYPDIALTLTYPWSTDNDLTDLAGYIGKLNSTSFNDGYTDYPENTVCFLGVGLKKASSSDGVPIFTKQYQFAIKCSKDATGNTITWNTIMGSDGNFYETDPTLYSTADLNAIIG